MIDTPRVTLLLLAFEQERTVGAAIAGALAQTYPNLEIVVSDDASSDGTFQAMQAAVARYRGPHSLIINRNARNLGIGGHLNRIVAMSSGELLVVAAGDDVSLPSRCSRVVEAWLGAGRRPDLIASHLVDMDRRGRLHHAVVPADLAHWGSAADWAAGPPQVIGAAHAWTRRLCDRFGPLPDAAFGADRLMAFRAVLAGGAVTLPEVLVQYRRGGVSQRRPARSSVDTIDGLLQSNRHALVEVPQMLDDARTAGQLDVVQSNFGAELARACFVRDVFAAPSQRARLAVTTLAAGVPWAVRARLLVYAAWPGVLRPIYAIRRWRLDRRGTPRRAPESV